jgi:predicted Zn-ribbon and HTH transcriptional regulator
MITCKFCGSTFPRENEGDYPGVCPECSIELEEWGLLPDDVDEVDLFV